MILLSRAFYDGTISPVLFLLWNVSPRKKELTIRCNWVAQIALALALILFFFRGVTYLFGFENFLPMPSWMSMQELGTLALVIFLAAKTISPEREFLSDCRKLRICLGEDTGYSGHEELEERAKRHLINRAKVTAIDEAIVGFKHMSLSWYNFGKDFKSLQRFGLTSTTEDRAVYFQIALKEIRDGK